MQQLLLQPRLDLLERFRRGFFGQAGEDGFALRRSEIFQNVGNVGRVQLGQPLLADFQTHATRRIAVDQVHAAPGNAAGGNVAGYGIDSAVRQTFQQTPCGAAKAYFDGVDAQAGAVVRRCRLPHEVHVIHANHLAPVHIDDLLVEEIAFEKQKLVQCDGGFRFAMRTELFRIPRRSLDLSDRQHGSLLSAFATIQHQAGYAGAVLGDVDDQLLHAAQIMAGPVEHGRPHQGGDASRNVLYGFHAGPWTKANSQSARACVAASPLVTAQLTC